MMDVRSASDSGQVWFTGSQLNKTDLAMPNSSELILIHTFVTCITVKQCKPEYTYIHRVFVKRTKYKRVTMRRGLSYKQNQTTAFSASTWKQEMSRLAVAVQMVDRTTIWDRRPWNFCLQINWVCAALTTIGCHWSWSSEVNRWCRRIISDNWQQSSARYASD